MGHGVDGLYATSDSLQAAESTPFRGIFRFDVGEMIDKCSFRTESMGQTSYRELSHSISR